MISIRYVCLDDRCNFLICLQDVEQNRAAKVNQKRMHDVFALFLSRSGVTLPVVVAVSIILRLTLFIEHRAADGLLLSC